MELRFLFSARCLIVVYICTKFRNNIFDDFEVTERTRSPTKTFKGGGGGGNSAESVGGVTVLVICTSCDGGLYMNKVL